MARAFIAAFSAEVPIRARIRDTAPLLAEQSRTTNTRRDRTHDSDIQMQVHNLAGRTRSSRCPATTSEGRLQKTRREPLRLSSHNKCALTLISLQQGMCQLDWHSGCLIVLAAVARGVRLSLAVRAV